MYYTITLNPAVDMLTKASNFSLGKLNRTQEAKYVVGGKGINISILLNNIGEKTKALGFVAGFTGYFIKSELDKLGIESRPLWKPMHLQPVYKNSPAYVNGVSEELFKKGLCLPSGPMISDEDAKFIIESIKVAIIK